MTCCAVNWTTKPEQNFVIKWFWWGGVVVLLMVGSLAVTAVVSLGSLGEADMLGGGAAAGQPSSSPSCGKPAYLLHLTHLEALTAKSNSLSQETNQQSLPIRGWVGRGDISWAVWLRPLLLNRPIHWQGEAAECIYTDFSCQIQVHENSHVTCW